MSPTNDQTVQLAARDAYVHAMRRVASSVAVVTTDGPAGCHGATVSAFSSVSADPPTILVCLRGGSRIAAARELGISERTLRYRLAAFRDAGIAVAGGRR